MPQVLVTPMARQGSRDLVLDLLEHARSVSVWQRVLVLFDAFFAMFSSADPTTKLGIAATFLAYACAMDLLSTKLDNLSAQYGAK